MTNIFKQENNPNETQSAKTLEEMGGPLLKNSLAKDTISDLFKDRDWNPSSKRDQKIPEKPLQKNASSPEEDVNKDTISKQEEKDEGEPQPQKQETPVELQRLQEELTKTQKRLTENQQYGRQNAQRLKNALKLAKEFVEEGSLNEEEAAKLINTLDTDTEEDLSSYATYPFGKVLAIANQELENIRKYTDDASLDDKIRAFDYFLMVSSKEEQEQALEDLTDMKDNPLKLAKAMLERGQRYQTSYQEMKAAGSLYDLLNKKDQTLLDLRKNLDKLTKKLAQYEDYDKPRYRLDEMGESEEAASQDSISSLFNDRDRIRRR